MSHEEEIQREFERAAGLLYDLASEMSYGSAKPNPFWGALEPAQKEAFVNFLKERMGPSLDEIRETKPVSDFEKTASAFERFLDDGRPRLLPSWPGVEPLARSLFNAAREMSTDSWDALAPSDRGKYNSVLRQELQAWFDGNTDPDRLLAAIGQALREAAQRTGGPSRLEQIQKRLWGYINHNASGWAKEWIGSLDKIDALEAENEQLRKWIKSTERRWWESERWIRNDG